jgi:uncharacterized membrane protein
VIHAFCVTTDGGARRMIDRVAWREGHAADSGGYDMDGNTPVTLAAARYSDRDAAVDDFNTVWDARGDGEFDHMAVAVLTKDASGSLQVERHDSTAKHLAWGGAILGAALVVVAPPVGASVLASAGAVGGAGALVGHFHHNIPKKDVEAAGELLESGQSGLIVVAVNRRGEDIEPLLKNAEKTQVTNTTWGDLDAEIAKEIANARTNPTSS